MAQQRNAEDAGALARLSEEVDQWRRTRAKLGPMPAHLWKKAAALARRLGVNPVKTALGLNYEVLRSHAEVGDQVASSPGGRTTRFVELSGAEVLGVPATTGSVVEVFDAGGARLTVRLVAGAELDVARLVEAFRRPAA